ncbi:MAG TPA: hypothetical protein VFY39_02115 [Gammaproteobacteria bacterium]|nr:hypothetical protein [Gammaproteobacteria bacterium]
MSSCGMIDDDRRERDKRLRRSAWLLAAFAAAVYLGFMLWMALGGG